MSTIKVIDLEGTSRPTLSLQAIDSGTELLSLMVSPSYPGIDIARGLVPGQAYQYVQATNPDVGNTFEDLWDMTGVLSYASVGETWEILSDDANDTSGGSGATEILITYLDNSYIKQTETKIMNGTTPVTFTATNAFRFREARVIDGGGTPNDKKNAGDITIRIIGGGSERGRILAEENKTYHGHYTVPAGKTAFLIGAASNVNKNKDAEIKHLATTGDNGIFISGLPLSLYQNTVNLSGMVPRAIVEKSDTKFMAEAQNPGTKIAATCVFLVVDN